MTVPDVTQRDIAGVVKSVPRFVELMRRERIDECVSTGAAIALPAFIAAKRLRLQTTYIESVSRVLGPSLTGRLVARSRLANELYSQHPAWVRGRWQHAFSVLDAFERIPKHADEGAKAPSLFVTLGTLKRYPFERLVQAVQATGLSSDRIAWQLGVTPSGSLPGEVRDFITQKEFDAYATAADVVISHAGVGSAIRLLELGKYPILVPRRARRNEHIDDHQCQIADYLATRSLALTVSVEALSTEHIAQAASYMVVRRE
ncbi:glycosyltransferase [Geodermatophilus sp. URMC 63]